MSTRIPCSAQRSERSLRPDAIGFVDEPLEHLLRRPLREQDAPIGGFDRDAHPLPLRVERLHPHDVPFAEQHPGIDPAVGRCRRDRRLHRFHGRIRRPIRRTYHLVGGQQARGEQLVDRLSAPGVLRRYLGFESARIKTGEAHPVLGDRSGLIGADDRRGPEGLDSLQPLSDRSALGHPLHPEREGNGEHGGQSLRDCGDRERDPDQDAVGQRFPLSPGQRGERHAEEDGRPQQNPGESLEPALQRRRRSGDAHGAHHRATDLGAGSRSP